jgi:hypothetical protein
LAFNRQGQVFYGGHLRFYFKFQGVTPVTHPFYR